MRHLFTPWRKNYMRGERTPGCFFCAAAAAPKERWRESLVVARGADWVVLLNRFPYTTGHLLLAPAAHLASPGEATPELAATLGRLQRALLGLLHAAYRPHGLNAGLNLGQAAGAGVTDHFHWHLLPRWNGDSNFIGSTGETRVLAETLEETLERLAPLAAKDPILSGG